MSVPPMVTSITIVTESGDSWLLACNATSTVIPSPIAAERGSECKVRNVSEIKKVINGIKMLKICMIDAFAQDCGGFVK